MFGDAFLFEKFKGLQNQLNMSSKLSNLLDILSNSRLSSKLANPAFSSNMYWSISKSFLNNKRNLCIPLFHENKRTTSLKQKVELFNTFFFQALLFLHYKCLALNLAKLQITWFCYFLNWWLAKVINNVNPNKAQYHYIISIRMVKLWRKFNLQITISNF